MHSAPSRFGTPHNHLLAYSFRSAWLGHVSLATTNVYAEIDLQMKAKALANCEVDGKTSGKPWKEDAGLMDFLRAL